MAVKVCRISDTMKYRTLGNTDLHVSRLCFGCWQLSPSFWGDAPQDDWEKAVSGAADLGVNFIDTADAYGDGYAEEQLGKVLKKTGQRDKFVLATKFFWNFEQKKRHPDTGYDYILRACENSLKRLQVDHIDLYQIHSWDHLTRPDEVAAALLRLRQEGKVRYFGVSNQNVEQMELYNAHFPVDCLQPSYSLLSRNIEARELPYCLRKGMGVIAYSPLFRGLLTGKYRSDETFNDHRKDVKYFHGDALKCIVEGLEKIQPIADRLGLTIAQLAIRWITTHPALTSAIIGVKKLEHLETLLPAVDEDLSRPDWHAVAGAMHSAKQAADKS